jgi:hypothetical protein
VLERFVELVVRRGYERSGTGDCRCRSGTTRPFGLRSERRQQCFCVGDPAQREQRLDLVGRSGFGPRITES